MEQVDLKFNKMRIKLEKSAINLKNTLKKTF